MGTIKTMLKSMFQTKPKLISYNNFSPAIKLAMIKNALFFFGVGFAVFVYGFVVGYYFIIAGLLILAFGTYATAETYYRCSRDQVTCIEGTCTEVVREGYRKQQRVLYVRTKSREMYKVPLPKNKGKYKEGDIVRIYNRHMPAFKDEDNCYKLFSFITIERVILDE